MPSTKAPHRPPSVTTPRIIISAFITTAILLPNLYTPLITHFYSYLLHSPIYRCSLFETAEILLLYALIEPIYTYRFAHHPYRRLDVRSSQDHAADTKSKLRLPRLQRPSSRLSEMAKSIFPLATMDLIMIKKYAGVSVQDIRQSGGYDPTPTGSGRGSISHSFLAPTLHHFTWNAPLQFTRALPADTPSKQTYPPRAANRILHLRHPILPNTPRIPPDALPKALPSYSSLTRRDQSAGYESAIDHRAPLVDLAG